MDWKRIPSLAALRAFEAAARYESFTRAAQELNVTQAAIAQHVRNLETDLSESLVTRQGRGIALTETGKHLADCLAHSFELIGDAIEQIRTSRDARPLSITVTPTFASNWLMPRIGDFWSKHPDIALNINPSTTLLDIRRDGIDLAIRYGEGNWPGLNAKLLADGDFWVVAHPDLVKGRTFGSLAEIGTLPWLLEDQMKERTALLDDEGLNLSTVALTLLSTNSMVIAGVKAALGVTIQPKSLVEVDVTSGALVKICELSQPNLGYYCVTVPGREPKGLRVFLAWLARQADEARA